MIFSIRVSNARKSAELAMLVAELLPYVVCERKITTSRGKVLLYKYEVDLSEEVLFMLKMRYRANVFNRLRPVTDK